MKNHHRVLLLTLGLIIVACGCLKPPPSFVQTQKPEWKVMQLKEGVNYDQAWQDAIQIISAKYKIDNMNKETGYIETEFIYTYPQKKGSMSDRYPAKVIVQFDKEKNECRVRVESNFITWRGPVPGTDKVLVDSVFNELQQKIGKTAK